MMSTLVGGGGSQLEIVVGLTGFVIIHVLIVSFSHAQGECNQMVDTKFTRPVNEMPMSSPNRQTHSLSAPHCPAVNVFQVPF